MQVFDLILTTRSPLFIGNGKSYTKKEYLFDPESGTVSVLDERLLFSYLADHNLADAYEGYILRNTSRNLWDFLLSVCQVPQVEIDRWTRYRVHAGDALEGNRALKEIQRFIRNGNDQIYVPGSSIKGALRTVLLKAMLLVSPPQNPDENLPFERYNKFEDPYFHTLALKKDKNQNIHTGNPLNSILQGVRVSDSLPIADSALCLTRKIDVFPDGGFNQINICRESIKPGITIVCTMTLDQSILHGSITRESLEEAISRVSAHYRETVLGRYPNAVNYMNDSTILLGGGVGFHSKTVTDAYYGDRALAVTAGVLGRRFYKHEHGEDVYLGRSPRTLKETAYNHTTYPYGVCEVSIR